MTAVKQKRPDEMLNIIFGDYQARYEHAFAWSTVCAKVQNLPGLRAFWPCGSADQYEYIIDESGQGNHLSNNAAEQTPLVLVNNRPLPPYVEFTGHNYLEQRDPGGGGGTIYGSGTTPEVAYWIGPNTIGGDPGVTLDATNNMIIFADGGGIGIGAALERLTFDAGNGLAEFEGIVGITVEDGDWIGNGAATARLGFDSSGGTDYAYFEDCNVGIGKTDPSFGATGGKLTIQEDYDFSSAEFEDHAHVTIYNDTNSTTGSHAVILFHTDLDSGSSMRSGIVATNVDSAPALQLFGNIANKDPNDIPEVTITGGNFGINETSPGAKLHVDQSDATAAIPVLTLDQGDVDQPYIEFLSGTVYAGKTGQDEYIKVLDSSGNTRYLKLYA